MNLVVADMHTYKFGQFSKGFQVTLFDQDLFNERGYKELIEFLYYDALSDKHEYEPIIKYVSKELVLLHDRTTRSDPSIYQEAFNCSMLQAEFPIKFHSVLLGGYDVTIINTSAKCFLESKKDYLKKIVRPNKNFQIDLTKYDENLWYTYAVFHKAGASVDLSKVMTEHGRFMCSDERLFMRDYDNGSKFVSDIYLYDYQKLCYSDTINIDIERLTGTQFGVKYLDKILSM